LFVGNLNVKRDFGYAPNYVEAMWKILQSNKADDFIICSGKSVLLRDIVEYIFNKLGLNKNLIVESEEFSDQMKLKIYMAIIQKQKKI